MRISDWSSDVCSSDLEQAALLAVGGRGIAQRAFEEATEDVAHTDGGHTGTDSGETGADERSSLNVHFILLGKNVDYTVEISVQIARLVPIEHSETRENIGLDAGEQQLEAAGPDHQRPTGDPAARKSAVWGKGVTG